MELALGEAFKSKWLQEVLRFAKHFIGDGGTLAGVDQGDNRASEQVLRDIHGAGYVAAIDQKMRDIEIELGSAFLESAADTVAAADAGEEDPDDGADADGETTDGDDGETEEEEEVDDETVDGS